MDSCNWLRAEELANYHTLVTLWKILNNNKPVQLAEKFTWSINRKITVSNPRLAVTESYFRWRSANLWKNLSSELRNTMKISSFKKNLKIWLKESRNK